MNRPPLPQSNTSYTTNFLPYIIPGPGGLLRTFSRRESRMSDGSDSGVDGSDRDEDNEFGLVSGTSAGRYHSSSELLYRSMSGVLSTGQATPRGGAYIFPFRRRSKLLDSGSGRLSSGDSTDDRRSISPDNLGEPLLPTVTEGRALESFDNDMVVPRRRAHTLDESDPYGSRSNELYPPPRTKEDAIRRMRNTLVSTLVQSYRCFVWAVVCMVVVLTVSYAALFIWALTEVFITRKSDCDQPLLPWVEVYMVITFLTDALQKGLEWIYCRIARGGRPLQDSDPLPSLIVLFRSIISLFYPIWFGYGLHLLSLTRTCSRTAPSLYILVQCFVWVGLLVWSVALLTLFTVSLTLCLVKAGWIQGPGAAKKGIINRIRLVPAGPNEGTCAICAKDMSYDGDEEGLTRRTLLLFLSDHDEDYSAPPTGGFTTSNTRVPSTDHQYAASESRYPMLRELVCGHRFHRACLSRWLNTSHTCPICHLNLHRAYDINYDV